MKDKILELRAQGKSYREIQEILGCSRGTVSYHCGKGQKQKTQHRAQKYRTSMKHKIHTKINNYLAREKGNYNYKKRSIINHLLYKKITTNPICYLTGRKIDLQDSSTFCLDHITPYHLTQDNSINNMGILCKNVNSSKAHLTVDQYIALCKEVLEHNGYTVIKK